MVKGTLSKVKPALAFSIHSDWTLSDVQGEKKNYIKLQQPTDNYYPKGHQFDLQGYPYSDSDLVPPLPP